MTASTFNASSFTIRSQKAQDFIIHETAHLFGHGPRQFVLVEPHALEGLQVAKLGRHIASQFVGLEMEFQQSVDAPNIGRNGTRQLVVVEFEDLEILQGRNEKGDGALQFVALQGQLFQILHEIQLPWKGAIKFVKAKEEGFCAAKCNMKWSAFLLIMEQRDESETAIDLLMSFNIPILEGSSPTKSLLWR
jgi:hypothetical protein